MSQNAHQHWAQQHWTDEHAIEAYQQKERWTQQIMQRVSPLLATGAERPRVVEIGSAQGLMLVSLARMGFEAYGIEPWQPAVEQARRLAQSMNVEIRIDRGFAESLPYPDNFCDCVLAFSVMEHTKDLGQALRECHRVLKPGGVVWFNISSAVCPTQSEIAWFPCFGWYPLSLKRRIMYWALKNKPAWIGNSDTPALQWVSPWSGRRALRAAGFEQVWDRWDLRAQDGAGLAAKLVASNMLTKTLADMCISTLSFAASKPAGSTRARAAAAG
jgi:ubiquinone/menaquinone biosynthesis C-methylase UbiE